MGGGFNDRGSGLALDGAGNAYVTGWLKANDLTVPAEKLTVIGDRPTSTAYDGFLLKIDPTATGMNSVLYCVYLAAMYAEKITVDALGRAYVTGRTGSISRMPPVTPNAMQPTITGGGDAFIIRLNPTGTDYDYLTFLGGSLNEIQSTASPVTSRITWRSTSSLLSTLSERV